MPLIDRRHLLFVLDEVLDAASIFQLPAFAAQDREIAAQILDAAEKLAVAEFLPSYRLLDANEPRMQNGRVVLPGEIGQALAAFREHGFFGMAADAADGGLGLPRVIANAAFLWFQAANISIANYAMLTQSAAELLAQHATSGQKQRYLLPLVEGRFLGTMALSEPQAGSSLSDITTTAKPLGDGRYAIHGTKMWISGGEHDMVENIVHLMLARIDGAPKGVKGISLFIVPRKRLDDAGRSAVWNNITLTSLNHKMGQRGTVNTALSLGEGGETIGEIVGAPGQGLACMFTMMNEARIGVSMGAVAHASAAYRHSLAYARERLQGRHPDTKDPASPQVPLIAHADVKRMLLQQKAAAEGGIALALYLAKLADLKKAADTALKREEAGLLLDLLTPVFKAWMSEECLTANSNAMQILGGAGYTRDHPVEQHYRDNRLNPIHEGTNGIQAIDLLGRKVGLSEGRGLALFLAEVEKTSIRASQQPELAAHSAALDAACVALNGITKHLAGVRRAEGPRASLAKASLYMDLFGTITFAWIWLEQAAAALASRPSQPGPELDFRLGLLQTCTFVFERILPRYRPMLEPLLSPGDPVLAMRDEWFGCAS